MTPCPVSIASDLTVAFQAGHLLPLPDADLPALMNWAPGAACGTHAIASTVKHKGQGIVQEGHDLGALIPHLTNSIAVLKSSRKIAFAASTVVIQSKPGGCTKLSMPMLACADITLPLGDDVNNFLHSVIMGMTSFDIQIGWFDVATAAVVDTVSAYLGVAKGGEVSSKTDVLKDAFGVDDKKSFVGAPFALARSALVSYHNDWKTPIGTKLGLGGGVASASREWSYDPVKKTLTVKDTATGPGGAIEDSTSFGPGGVRTGTKAKTSFDGGQDHQLWGDKL